MTELREISRTAALEGPSNLAALAPDLLLTQRLQQSPNLGLGNHDLPLGLAPAGDLLGRMQISCGFPMTPFWSII